MRKEKPPPVQAKMLDAQGNLNPMWQNWFQRVGMFFNDYRRSPDLVYTADTTLTTDDYGKIIVFNTAASALKCTLMVPSARDVYGWLTIFRSGAKRLTITNNPATRIEYGSMGGRIWNDEVRRYGANVTLQLLSVTQWGIIGATGLWKVA